jgi:hypothetical protein
MADKAVVDWIMQGAMENIERHEYKLENVRIKHFLSRPNLVELTWHAAERVVPREPNVMYLSKINIMLLSGSRGMYFFFPGLPDILEEKKPDPSGLSEIETRRIIPSFTT